MTGKTLPRLNDVRISSKLLHRAARDYQIPREISTCPEDPADNKLRIQGQEHPALTHSIIANCMPRAVGLPASLSISKNGLLASTVVIAPQFPIMRAH
jgi:hypothetical protein